MSVQARTLPPNRRLVPAAREGAYSVQDGAREVDSWDPTALPRRLRFIGRTLAVLAIAAVGITAAMGARRYVTSSPRFGLRNLTVQGTHHRTAEGVAATGGIALGQNVVDLDLETARKRIESDPWIAHASIARRLPSTVSIEVVERQAAALIAFSSGTYLATSSGEIFKRLEDDDPRDLPIITGIAVDSNGGDRQHAADAIRRALDLASEIQRCGLFGGEIEELHVEPNGGLTAVVGKRGVRVKFGREGLRAKTRLATKIEAELARRSARPTILFLDDDEHPERIVVRLVAALPGGQVTVDGPPHL